MLGFLDTWRFYSFGREQYQECISRIFCTNLLSLRKANQILAIFAGVCTIFPILIEQSLFKAGVYASVALIGLLISIYANYLMQQINVNNKIIYLLIILFYFNVMIFGTYLDVWSNTDSAASIFPCFMVCILLIFVVPPHFILFLTLCGLSLFVISALVFIDFNIIAYYIINAAIASFLCLYFTWQITKLQLGLEISTTLLEEERNKYVDQSITDELTKLRNRRDFMNTFQRYLSNYRSSDDWLCIAIADIDFFKFYNDHYGHPKGDDCLRSIGAALNSLKDELSIYAARVGGEEFALLWFEKEASHVDKVVKHWIKTIKDLKIPHEKSKVNEYVTMSIGLYIIPCGSSNDLKALYDLADKALYTAKGSGRNCAIVTGKDIEQYKIAIDT